MPPRATPGDYSAHAQAGDITVAAEFTGHSIVTLQGPLSAEDYLVFEVGFFGPAGARVKLAPEDFTLRLNGKKTPLATQPYGLVIAGVKDPEWEPPKPAKSKTSLNSGGDGGQQDNSPPPPVHVPIEVQHAMALRVQKAALPEGDRAVPVAGLIFFRYSGRIQKIGSMELRYAGSAGSTALRMQP